MTTSEWLDESLVARWIAADTQADFLQVPRRISAAIVAIDNPSPKLIIDIGSGPGDYLAIMLEAFDQARGVWSDLSPAMADTARERLAPFGDRVEYQTADMLDLDALPGSADVITTSRASHHLDPESLTRFYTSAAAHLAPGGWLVNLDHTRHDEAWDKRLRAARRMVIPPAAKASGHHHPLPQPTPAEHLAGLAAAGLTDVDVAWQGLNTSLFMARKG